MKIKVLFLMIFLCGFMVESAHAGCASVDDGFDISFPCVEFEGGYYGLNLMYKAALSSQGGHFWKFQGGFPASENGDCIEVGDDLKLPAPCAEYGGADFQLTLDYRGGLDGSDGVYWELGSLFEVARSTKSRETSPEPSDEDFTEFISGLTSFTLDFFRTTPKDQGENLFFSPHSISTALAMAYAGARGETASQMETALRFTLPDSRLHTAFNALDRILASRGEGAQGQDGGAFRLNVNNALWGQRGYAFVPAYLDVLAENYGAGLGLLDFFNAPDLSRIVINDWVSDRTEEKIKDLIPPGGVNTDTRLVITNAIYFNAAWFHPFEETLTSREPFHLLGGGSTTASMMSQTEYFRYAEGENWQAVEIPYDGGELSMVVLLPSEGEFETFESNLDTNELDAILAALASVNVHLKLPRFKYEGGSISLKNILTDMGMLVAFTDTADFSGIDGSDFLFIGDVVHKAYISVDEAGTEAAAATGVIFGVTGLPPEPVEMFIDRPFIFFIRDIDTGAILFFGRIVQPE